MTTILTIDIGGTKTELSLWQSDCCRPRQLSSLTIPTDYQNATDLAAPIAALYQNWEQTPPSTTEAAVLAFAGPTNSPDGILRLTNNPCSIDIAELRSLLLTTCRLAILNDLEAFAHSLDFIAPASLKSLTPATPPAAARNYPRIAAAIGTGFGLAALLPGGRVIPTEAGHTIFAPSTPELANLCHRFNTHPVNNPADNPNNFSATTPLTTESILSGNGICGIFHALRPDLPPLTPAEITRLATTPDANCPPETTHTAKHTLSLLAAACGATLANAALMFLPLGGIYLGGGVISHIADTFDTNAFRHAFLPDAICLPDTIRQLLLATPVYLVTDPSAVSLGAAIYAEHFLLG